MKTNPTLQPKSLQTGFKDLSFLHLQVDLNGKCVNV